MTTTFGTADIGRFRAAIARGLGLHFDDSKLGTLAELLQRRADLGGRSVTLYLDCLECPTPHPAELRELAKELTVAETYFFRHAEQLRAFAEVALPERLVARSSAGQIRVLSAGCASGEEPYSLAILVRERRLDPRWNISVRAVDINATMLERAAHARYSAWSLRETPEEIQHRWFRPEGRAFALEQAVRGDVMFEERNLALDDADLWWPGSYDIVFCRNVMMYFTPENAQRLVARMAQALVLGGYLFLGHAETLRGLSQDFHLQHTHGTFYYQRKEELEARTVATTPREIPQGVASFPKVETRWASTWIENVQHAAERIRALSARPPASEAERAVSTNNIRVGGAELNVALELLKTDSFAQALALVDDLPADTAGDPDVLLLRAILLTHGGRIAEAEKVCGRLLECDELSAGAHYVIALCREGAGDRQGAIDHDQVATYLDPTFAMPRLHLGLLARRAAEWDVAKQEIEHAVLLLQRDDASRLLMFGGGFSRDALVALCRAELAAMEGSS